MGQPAAEYFSELIPTINWNGLQQTVLKPPSDCPVLVAIREVKERGISELLVHSPDYDGLFSAVTTVIDEIGLDVLSARVGTTTSGKSFDLFQLMDSNAQSLNDIDSERLKDTIVQGVGRCQNTQTGDSQVAKAITAVQESHHRFTSRRHRVVKRR